MSAPLISWKRQPPDEPEAAAAAKLLRAVGEAPTLSREAAARIRSRVQGGKRGRGPLGRQKQLFPLLLEPRISLLAAGLAMLAILAALIALFFWEPVSPKAPRAQPSQQIAPKPGGEPSH